VASLAEDKKMIEIFKQDLDIHRATAAAINNVSLDEVTKEMRRAAKEINFGILYGMGSYGLSWRAEITQYQAKQFIDKYFQEFSGVKKYLEHTLEFVKENGYAETLFGRRRYIPELLSGNYQLRNAAERMAINHPVQGTAADLMKMAMIAVDKKLKQWPKEKQQKVKMILQVHDELVFELDQSIKDELGALIKETMETVCVLRVPIKVDVNFGKSWGEMK
jgi:DNA polymerase-1